MKIKLKDGFVLRQIADTWVVMAIGETMMDFNGMITLNETGMFLWKAVGEGEELSALVSSLMMEYNVAKEQAEAATGRSSRFPASQSCCGNGSEASDNWEPLLGSRILL